MGGGVLQLRIRMHYMTLQNEGNEKSETQYRYLQRKHRFLQWKVSPFLQIKENGSLLKFTLYKINPFSPANAIPRVICFSKNKYTTI